MSKYSILLEYKKYLLYYQNRRGDKVIYPSIDKLLNEIGSKYLLVNLVSKRVKEMEQRKNYQMNENEYESKKNIGKALEEVSKKLIQIK